MTRRHALALAAGIALFLAVCAGCAPLPVGPDFVSLYAANAVVWRGGSPYDWEAQRRFVATELSSPTSQLDLPPFVYPPWYCLTTVWLAWMPYAVAGRVWLGVNLTLIAFALTRLTSSLGGPPRLVVSAAGLFYLPTLGMVTAGQYTAPILLGAALLAAPDIMGRPATATFALLLLSLKPHLGVPIGLVWLAVGWLADRPAARRVLTGSVVGLAALALASFALDMHWPQHWVAAIRGLSQHGVLHSPATCTGLPALFGFPSPHPLGLAIGGPLALVLLGLVFGCAPAIRRQPAGVIVPTALIVLLASPYSRIYDFLLMLPALVLCWTVAKQRLAMRAALAFVYLTPLLVVVAHPPALAPALTVSAAALLPPTINTLSVYIAGFDPQTDNHASPERSPTQR